MVQSKMKILTFEAWTANLRAAVLVPLACALLAGCVTYYETEPYGLDTPDTGYISGYAGGYDGGYDHSFGISTTYYPWWSMDYFYLGFGYPGYYRGYPAWSPWYAYYRPWYYYQYPGFAYGWSSWGPYAGFGYGGYDPYWYHRYRVHAYRPPHQHPSGDRGPLPVGSHGGQLSGPGYRPGIEDAIRDRETMRRDGSAAPQQRVVAPLPSVMVAPRRDDRGGMTVIGGAQNKIPQSRPAPVPPGGGGFGLPSQSRREPAPGTPAVSVRPPPAMPRVESPAVRSESRSLRGADRPSSDDGPASFRGGRRSNHEEGR